jgi:cysteine sulfinate desulfinase/cysteine desulfurase-like protein
VPRVELNGHPTRRAPGILNVTIGGVEGESLLFGSTTSHCRRAQHARRRAASLPTCCARSAARISRRRARCG